MASERAHRLPTLLVSLGILLTACDEAEFEHSGDVQRLTQIEQSLSIEASFGSEDGPSFLGRIMSARLTPDGTRIVVLDASAPHLKVFRRDTGLERAFVRGGGGPTEVESAAAVATTDDAVILAGRGSLSIVRLTGDTVYRHRPPLLVTDIDYRCGGSLTAYGPGGYGRTQFVHSLDLASDLQIRSSTYERERPTFIGWSRSVIGGADGAVVAHRADRTGPVELAYVNCAGELKERPWAWAVSGFPSQMESSIIAESRSGSRISTFVSPAVPVFAGAGELQGRLLWVETSRVRSEGVGSSDRFEDRTFLYLADERTVRAGYVRGRFRLQDISDSYVLLSTAEPWPRVSIVRTFELLDSLEAAKIVANSRQPGV